MRSLKLICKPFKEYLINTKNYSKISYHIIIPVLFLIVYIALHTQNIYLNNILNSTQVFLPFVFVFSFSALIALSFIENDKMKEVKSILKKQNPVQLQIHHLYKGKPKITPLTNKMFLSIMLGYISFMSAILFISSIVLLGSDDTFFYVANWWLENTDRFTFLGYFIYTIYYLICFLFIWGIASIITNLLYAIRIFTTSSCDIY